MTNGYGLYFIEDGNARYPEGVVVWILMPTSVNFRCFGVRYGHQLSDRIRLLLGQIPCGLRRTRDFSVIWKEHLYRKQTVARRTRVIEERQTGRVLVPQYAQSRRHYA